MTAQAISICSIGAELGEGPLWTPHDKSLWFVDIPGKLHLYRPEEAYWRAWSAAGKIFVVPVRRGSFLVGVDHRLCLFDPQTGRFQDFAVVAPQRPDNRLNDACVSLDNELWFGSMHDPELQARGALYRWDFAAGAVMLDDGYIVTNGPAFSPDGRTFYHKSPSGVIAIAAPSSPRHGGVCLHRSEWRSRLPATCFTSRWRFPGWHLSWWTFKSRT